MGSEIVGSGELPLDKGLDQGAESYAKLEHAT